MTGESLVVRCVCGWETAGAEDDVVEATIDHGRRLHNMESTREQVLALAVRDGGDRVPADAPEAGTTG
jgi:predicted small metal-binding protein